jgi:hypothetical protein
MPRRENITDPISKLRNRMTIALPNLPTSEALQPLLADLNNVAQAYSTAPDLNGYISRV